MGVFKAHLNISEKWRVTLKYKEKRGVWRIAKNVGLNIMQDYGVWIDLNQKGSLYKRKGSKEGKAVWIGV